MQVVYHFTRLLFHVLALKEIYLLTSRSNHDPTSMILISQYPLCAMVCSLTLVTFWSKELTLEAVLRVEDKDPRVDSVGKDSATFGLLFRNRIARDIVPSLWVDDEGEADPFGWEPFVALIEAELLAKRTELATQINDPFFSHEQNSELRRRLVSSADLAILAEFFYTLSESMVGLRQTKIYICVFVALDGD